MPVRGGDVLRLYLAHRAVPGSTYTTLASTTVVMGITDAALALVFFAYALTLGVLPGISLLPDLAASTSCGCSPILARRAGSCSPSSSPASALMIWLRPRIDDFQGPVLLSLRRPPHADALSPHGRRPGSSPTGACGSPRSGSSSPPSASIKRERDAGSGHAQPRHPGSDQPGRDRNRAGVPGHRIFQGKVSGAALLAFSVGSESFSRRSTPRRGAVALLLMLRTLRYKQYVEAAPPSTRDTTA